MSPADIAKTLTTGQRNRLVAIARAGTSLKWGRSEDALFKKRLVRKYRDPFGETFSDLTSDGLAVAQAIFHSR